MAWQVLVTELLFLGTFYLALSAAYMGPDLTHFCDDPKSLGPCPLPQRGTACQCIINESRSKARCCHVGFRIIDIAIVDCLKDKKLPRHELRTLFLNNCTADNDELNLTNLGQWFPNIESVSLNNGGYNSIKELQEPLNGTFKNLKCLNLSSNVIEQSGAISQIIDAIPSLAVIDVSNNNITYAPRFQTRKHTLWLNLEGNSHLKCDGLTAADERNFTFINMNETQCESQSSYSWFNSSYSVTLWQVVSQFNANKDCPEHCTCTPGPKVELDKKMVYRTQVSCVGQHLQQLPQNLPISTHSLNVSYNNISDLQPIIHNKIYDQLKFLILDHNNITSLAVLEGSKFIEQFELLSLRYNRLDPKIAHHILSNSVEKNWNSAIYLGHNYIDCDCSTYQIFQKWLISIKKSTIPDYDFIYCKNTNKSVMLLNNFDVCVADDTIQPYLIYYLIGIEVALLFLLIGKVTYDYWVFKNVGYLPWPASKMPKLPCDCVFET